ncbi:S-adenosyl-L-methionine-dependent methyltransferase [Myriangium duriaei CBS 260.36]|uniref:DNA (cytosine-5-)-methyltransferase n=1 Tax=Myriangium duriaei CBS 260.36 TaxID=1168546 RepID=A0A9P4J559_9PEZI|nr:S-adenosyl-L-methionine-dependent methyltransferase [Myriangium duriaei CBS 260.36]
MLNMDVSVTNPHGRPHQQSRWRSDEVIIIDDDVNVHIEIPDEPDVVEIPDDDDVELVSEGRPQVRNSEKLSRLFRAGGISPYWEKIDEDPTFAAKIGDVLELNRSGEYLQIKKLFIDATEYDVIVFCGVRFRKLTEMFPGFEGDDNEVIMLQDVFKDSTRSHQGLYLENFTFQDMKYPINKTTVIRFTNQLRADRYQRGRLTDYMPGATYSTAPFPVNHLVCRSRYTVYYDTICNALRPRKTEEVWANLSDEEVDPGSCVDDTLLRAQNREARGRSSEVLTDEITACDCFCGAGFASVGAKASGLKVATAFDINARAMETYRRNHSDVKRTLRMDFAEVLRRYGHRINEDVLMMSFPCQFFSPAHTNPGKLDDANEVLMFGLGDFLAATKPRVVVIEQTFGLHATKFRQHLMAVVAAFRNNDYSIRKAVINFAGLGEASKRRRLIIIGAAPGERLPPLPKQMFNIDFASTDPNLLPAVSVADRLQLVIGNAPDHLPFLRNANRSGHPYDPRTAKLGTITCGRSAKEPHNYHWSGLRFWTPHELKILQGAPPTFQLKGCQTDMLRQVGNAFPCIAAEQIYKEVVQSLRKTNAEDRNVGMSGSSPDVAIAV